MSEISDPVLASRQYAVPGTLLTPTALLKDKLIQAASHAIMKMYWLAPAAIAHQLVPTGSVEQTAVLSGKC